jgi:hypothetical protein
VLLPDTVPYFAEASNSFFRVLTKLDEMRLYINGTLVNSIPLNSPMAINNTNSLVLGSNFEGLLDEVRYYQKPLSSRQVEWLYFNEKP